MKNLLSVHLTHPADWAAASSGAIAATTWMTQLNELLQMGATAVAIVAGLYAVAWHRVRIKETKQRMDNEQSKRSDS